jgi:hypothetical protein
VKKHRIVRTLSKKAAEELIKKAVIADLPIVMNLEELEVEFLFISPGDNYCRLSGVMVSGEVEE